MMTRARWIKLDAINRMWRSFLHVVGAGALVAAGDAAWQVVVNDLVSSNGHLDWGRVGARATTAAMLAFVAPLLAYGHRRWVDKLPIPSAVPPPEPLPPRLPTAPRNER